MKEKPIQLSATQHLINYLKEQIRFFSRRPNLSERMAGYYRDELNKLQDD